MTATGETQTKRNGRILRGTVVSDKMQDTIVVSVERYVKHPKIGKYVRLKKKYKVDDKGNTKRIGELVSIQETNPISKDKHFVVIADIKN